MADIDPQSVNISQLLTTARTNHDEGCLNEPMRIFSDVGWNEDIVNNLDNVLIDTDGNGEYYETVSTSTAEHVVEQTIKRMSQCVIGILERPEDTKRVLKAYLPWLGDIIQVSAT